jgi:hypothetical protein
MEKRSDKRRRICTSIVCSYSSSLQDGHAIIGQMKNCCPTGFYAELNARVKAGTVLVVQAAGNLWGLAADHESRPSALAEVKWSKPISIKGEGFFPTGLRYLTAWSSSSRFIGPPQPTGRKTTTGKERTP